MADPDLQIRAGGGGGGGGAALGRKGGGARSQKNFFSVLWALVWSKNKGGEQGSLGPSPGSATALNEELL